MKTGKIWLSLLTLLATSAAVPAFAADEATGSGETTMKVEDAKGVTNKTSGPDVDELITNNKLRAETGSKSKWSIGTAFSYSGGSVEKPLAEDRPNIAGATGTTDKAWLDGSVSTKYNMTSQNSLSAGVGLRWITPLNGKPHNYDGDRFDVQNPYMTFQRLYKWSGIQSVLQLTPTLYTNNNLVNSGYVSSLALAQDNIYEVGHTGLSIGLYLALQGAVYNKSGLTNADPDHKDATYEQGQSDYGFSIDPYAEYAINDKVNLRTVSNLGNYEHIRSEKRFATLQLDKVFQSVGVGFSVTRDIFIYPNLQFLPDDIRADKTNVAINANVNVF